MAHSATKLLADAHSMPTVIPFKHVLIRRIGTIAGWGVSSSTPLLILLYSDARIVLKIHYTFPTPPIIKHTLVPNLLMTAVEIKLPMPMKKYNRARI